MVNQRAITRPKGAGFTLLELLVVLTIAGLLIALVPPVVSSVVPGTKAKVAARDLAATLRNARNLAVSRSTIIDVRFDTEAGSYAVAGAAPESLPRGMALAILGDDGQPRSASVDEEIYTLRFYADGSSNGLRARLGAGNSGYVVTVGWLMGRVGIVEAPSGGA